MSLAATLTYKKIQIAKAWWHGLKKLNDLIGTQVAMDRYT